MAGKVNIIEKGPSGTIQYSEGFWKKNTCEFYWEFGGGDVLATIWFPTEEKWNENYPWARGRRKEIMSTVAEQVRHQKARSSKIQWEDDRVHLVQN